MLAPFRLLESEDDRNEIISREKYTYSFLIELYLFTIFSSVLEVEVQFFQTEVPSS